jgi:hypothetical protein
MVGMNRLQLKLIDLFWGTGLVACIVGAITTATCEIALIGISSVLLFIWTRPVLLRFWTLAVVGIGVGLFVMGYNEAYAFTRLDPADSEAWGAAMAVGGILAFVLFDIRKPPASI